MSMTAPDTRAEIAGRASPARTRRGALQRLAAIVAVSAIEGCTSIITRPAPVRRTFLLDPPLPPAAGQGPKAGVLRIGAINVAAPFRGKQFVYRTSDLGFESDFYDEWFVPPGTMLADAVAKGLAAARVFERVVAAGTAGHAGDFVLDGFVSALFGDTRAGARASANLTVSFYLTAIDVPGSAPVWTREYAQRSDVVGAGPDALAQGLNSALGAVLRGLARDLAAADLPKPAP